MAFTKSKTEVENNGFSIINDMYTAAEVAQIISVIEQADASGETFESRQRYLPFASF